MSIQHVGLEPGSLVSDECEICGQGTLLTVTVYALTENGVQPFGEVDRCVSCEPLEAGDNAET